MKSETPLPSNLRDLTRLVQHRVKFLPNYYHRTAPNDKAAEKDPEHSSPIIGRDDSSSEQGSKKRKAAVFHEADNSRAATDVLEVWFAGCHSGMLLVLVLGPLVDVILSL